VWRLCLTTRAYACRSQGDFSKAIEYHAQHLAIAKEVGDRAGEVRAYGNLGTCGTCHLYLTEYVKAVAYFEAQHALVVESEPFALFFQSKDFINIKIQSFPAK
jgi:hypothetical protein